MLALLSLCSAPFVRPDGTTGGTTVICLQCCVMLRDPYRSRSNVGCAYGKVSKAQRATHTNNKGVHAEMNAICTYLLYSNLATTTTDRLTKGSQWQWLSALFWNVRSSFRLCPKSRNVVYEFSIISDDLGLQMLSEIIRYRRLQSERIPVIARAKTTPTTRHMGDL
jgi:hypothetical protein